VIFFRICAGATRDAKHGKDIKDIKDIKDTKDGKDAGSVIVSGISAGWSRARRFGLLGQILRV
jgi:hypothetical protein